MAVVVGGEHSQSWAKRAAATATAYCPVSADRALLPLLSKDTHKKLTARRSLSQSNGINTCKRDCTV
jgi:hypothetical protein